MSQAEEVTVGGKCPCCQLSPSEHLKAMKEIGICHETLVSEEIMTKSKAKMPSIGMVGAIKAPPVVNAVKLPRIVSVHHYLPATVETILWGYFSHCAKPALEIESGDFVTIETLTSDSSFDAERMVTGDSGAESVFKWDKEEKAVHRRGAGDIKAKNGAGGGLGSHILTGPIHIRGAEPGDVLEVRIIDVKPRPCANPLYEGKTFGVNTAANWGLHYGDCITEPKVREVVTIYELDSSGDKNWAKAVYSYRWTPQTDPDGVVHSTVDYPGIPVDHSTITKNNNVLKDIRIPVRAHFGTIGVAPSESDMVTSVPPSYTGGNIDDWRIGKGATVFYPVAVDGAMFSVGDPHASQGDAEICETAIEFSLAGTFQFIWHGKEAVDILSCGTAIECSLTGTFQFILHKKEAVTNTMIEGLYYPLLETSEEWILHGFSYANYLRELGDNAQQDIFTKSSLDLAMRDAYRKMRHFLMTAKGLDEDEAISLMSVGVDFGVTQVVDGNWGVHAILKKCIFL